MGAALGRGHELELGRDSSIGQVALRQDVEALPQVAGWGERDDGLTGVLGPGKAPGRDGCCRRQIGLLECLAQEVDLGGVERGLTGWSGGGSILLRAEAGDHREHRGNRVRVRHLGRALDHVVQVSLPGEHLADRVLFTGDVVLAHEGRHVAQGAVRFLLALEEAAQDAEVAGELLGRRVEEQGGDLGRVLLAVAVDAAVALLDADQAPRNVEVDQFVALGVQVDAFGRDVARDQHADR